MSVVSEYAGDVGEFRATKTTHAFGLY